MASTWCPPINSPAATIVGEAHSKFMALGTKTYDTAVADLNALSDISVTPLGFNVSFDFADPQATFQRPPRPDLDDGALVFRDPNVPIGPAPAFAPRTLVFDEAPSLDAQAPTLVFGPKPNAPDVPVPLPPVKAAELDMPVPPDYVLPRVPTLMELNLPEAPSVLMPEFTLDRPTFIAPPFNQSWTFEPEPYTETLVSTLTSTLKPMITGSAALPLAIERALFARGRSRIEVERQRGVDQAYSEFAARGFTEPQGPLAGRISELQQAAQHSTAETNRDVLIRHFELMYEQQRFAITQGAALEGTLIQLHVEEQRFALEAAKFQQEAALAVVNYRIQVYNAQLQGYQTEAQVVRDRMQAELAKIEVFRAQLEGEKARGELNVQRVQLYEGQLRGIQLQADLYRSAIETVKVKADINMQDIERYKAEVQAFGERWRAHVAEWQGYSAGVEGEGKRVDIFRAMVDANVKRVDAWKSSNDMQIEAERLRMAQHNSQLGVWQTGLDRLRALLQGEQARIAAVGQAADAQARIYTAAANVEQSASAAADRTFELGLSAERARVDTQLKSAEMYINQAVALLAQVVEITKAKAQVSSQLAASTMSAVNYGASVSNGVSASTSCNSSFNFNGEIADA